jgi:hypothetical protein
LSILGISSALIMLTRSIEAVQVAIGRQRAVLEFNLLRLACLLGGGLVALVRADAMLLVLTIGLLEIPVYGLGLFRMAQLHQIRWSRELSALIVVGAGFALGRGADFIGISLFPGL